MGQFAVILRRRRAIDAVRRPEQKKIYAELGGPRRLAPRAGPVPYPRRGRADHRGDRAGGS